MDFTEIRQRLHDLVPMDLLQKEIMARPSRPIGLDIGSRRIKLAELEVSGGRPAVARLIDEPVSRHLADQGVFSDPDGLADELSQFFDRHDMKRIAAVIMIGGRNVMVRRATIPRAPREEALRQIPSNDNIRLPLDPSKAQFDLVILDPEASRAKMDVVIAAAKRSAVEARQRAVMEAGVAVEAVDVDAFALFNAFQHCEPEVVRSGTTALLHIGHETSFVVVIRDGQLALARTMFQGVANLAEQIGNEGGTVGQREAERAVFSGNPNVIYPEGFSSWADALLNEVRRTTRYATRSGSNLSGIYLTGGGALIESVDTLLSERAGTKVRVFNPLKSLPRADDFTSGVDNYAGAAQAIALGLALRQVT